MGLDRTQRGRPSMSRRRMTRLRRWILFAWSATILTLAGLFVASMLLFRHAHCREESSRAFARLLPLVEDRLQHAMTLLYGELDELAEQGSLQESMRQRDYEGLCSQIVPIHRRMEKRYHMRSVGIWDLQGRRLVQVPAGPGLLSQGTQSNVMPIPQDGEWHIRRTIDADLVISVLRLWRIEGKLAGYLEATTRLDHILRDLVQASGISVDFLERMDAQSSKRSAGRKDASDSEASFSGDVSIEEKMLLAYAPIASEMLPGEMVSRTVDGRVFHVAHWPIQNESRQDAIHLILYQDVTEARASFRSAILVGLAVSVMVGVPLGIGFFVVWSRLDRACMRDYQDLHTDAAELRRELQRHVDRERQLGQDRELIHDVLCNIPVFAFWKDPQGRYQGGNVKFARLVGLDQWEELVGKTDEDLRWTEARRQDILDSDRRVLETGVPILNREETLHWPDGREISVLTSKVPLRDESGVIQGLLGIHTDVTNRRRAEDELRRRLTELRQFEAMSVGREHRMIQLKREVNELLHRLGGEPRYDLGFVQKESEEEPVS